MKNTFWKLPCLRESACDSKECCWKMLHWSWEEAVLFRQTAESLWGSWQITLLPLLLNYSSIKCGHNNTRLICLSPRNYLLKVKEGNMKVLCYPQCARSVQNNSMDLFNIKVLRITMFLKFPLHSRECFLFHSMILYHWNDHVLSLLKSFKKESNIKRNSFLQTYERAFRFY